LKFFFKRDYSVTIVRELPELPIKNPPICSGRLKRTGLGSTVAIIGSQVGVRKNELASDGVVVCILCVCFVLLDVKSARVLVSAYLFRFAQLKAVSRAL